IACRGASEFRKPGCDYRIMKYAERCYGQAAARVGQPDPWPVAAASPSPSGPADATISFVPGQLCTPARFRSTCTAQPRSAAAVRAGAGQRDRRDDPAVAAHGVPVVIPVRVLARNPAVVIDQQVHGLWQPDYLGRALGLDPVAEEAVVHH